MVLASGPDCIAGVELDVPVTIVLQVVHGFGEFLLWLT
jgi:hypothetical protein